MKLTEIATQQQDETVKRFMAASVKGKYTLREDGMYDVEGNVDLQIWGQNTPVKFYQVTGQFSCPKHKPLKNLSFAPVIVGDYFLCDWATLLSFDGIPKQAKRMRFTDGKFPPMKGIFKHIEHCESFEAPSPEHLLSLLQIKGLKSLHMRNVPLRLEKFVNDTLLKIPQEDRSVYEMQELLNDAGLEEYATL